MSKFEKPESRDYSPKSPMRDRVLAAIMAVIGSLGAGCASAKSFGELHSASFRNYPLPRTMTLCAKGGDINVDKYRHDCRKGTIETFKMLDMSCMECELDE